jgi:hypothetical protein
MLLAAFASIEVTCVATVRVDLDCFPALIVVKRCTRKRNAKPSSRRGNFRIASQFINEVGRRTLNLIFVDTAIQINRIVHRKYLSWIA